MFLKERQKEHATFQLLSKSTIVKYISYPIIAYFSLYKYCILNVKGCSSWEQPLLNTNKTQSFTRNFNYL